MKAASIILAFGTLFYGIYTVIAISLTDWIWAASFGITALFFGIAAYVHYSSYKERKGGT